MKLLSFGLFLFFISAVRGVANYKLIKLTDPEALCLDGSHAAYYINEGDPHKILISYEGGGWCGSSDLASTIENCYQRSKTALGSSLNYTANWTSRL